MNKKLKESLKIFRKPFNKKLIAELGKETNFVCRERKVTAEKFKDHYVGNVGGASKEAVKVHLEFDLLLGNFINLGVSSGTKSDIDYGWDILNTIGKNDLCIRDLGYFSTLYFMKQTERDSYYISKIKSNTKIYSYDEKYSKFSSKEYKKGELFEIDIAKISQMLSPNETFELTDILIGKTHICKNRLIITKLSEEIKKVIKENQRIELLL